MRSKVGRIGWVVGLLVLAAGVARGQWATQDIPLQPGWNAVWLELQPEPRALDTVLTNASIESVWKWDRRFSHIQFELDPYTLEPEGPHWLTWLPPSDPRRFLNRLATFQGQQAYLVKLATNAAPCTISLKGKVILPLPDWYTHGLNLIGFPVNPVNPPTFTRFLAFTEEIDTTRGVANELYTLLPNGRGQTVVLPVYDKIAQGKAYWVGCAGDPTFMGPIHVTPSDAGRLDFSTGLVRQELAIRNVLTDRAMTVRVIQAASELPADDFPELAGPVALSYMIQDASGWAWSNFPPAGLTQAIAPGGTWTIRLGIRRQDMPDYVPTGDDGAQYQSILQVTDSDNALRIRVPVVAEKASGVLGDPLDEHDVNEGLWVGDALINQVNAPAYSGTNLLDTPAPMAIRLIVHVNGSGEARLLQQVLLAWDRSLTNAPHTNGTYALYTEQADVPEDAERVDRISSVAFPLMAPLWLTGQFSNTLTGTVHVRFDDPTNPSLHRYHPLHDNKNGDFVPYTNAVETLDIHRAISLTFGAPPTNLVSNPYWGVDRAVGTYQETMTGLRAQPILLEGPFQLERVSRIDELQ